VFAVKTDFGSLGLDKGLTQVVRELGYKRPTPVQAACIPILLNGKDLIGQSKTGSGKTAAFALPILQAIDLERRAVQALVLCPTRELSAQVAREIRKLGRNLHGLAVVELVGGQPSRPQREALERGMHIAVGTPGRLLDHIQRDILDPTGIRTVVIDEADRMLDMGFGADVHHIVRFVPPSRQTVLFSATFPDSIEHLSTTLQRDPDRVSVEDGGDQVDIRQLRMDLETPDKLQALAWLLQKFQPESALVFCNFKASVAELTGSLTNAGISADRLDGDLDQFHRDQVLARFRNQSVRVLVATDVAGRGIDVEGLDMVVNFELPQQPEVYVHRIGRTGRAGKSGLAVTFTSARQEDRVQVIEELIGKSLKDLSTDGVATSNLDDLLRSAAGPPKMSTILISGGRQDKVRPGDILGALTGDSGGLQGSDIGKIEVQQRLSYVAVAHQHGAHATGRLNAGRIKKKRYRATLIQ
jgi:ATP-independent RNA helicase DbpA